MTDTSEEPFMDHAELSPLTISFMLACYYSADPEANVGDARWNSSAGVSVRMWLEQHGLIDDKNRATDRGKAWVRFICQTPLPEQAWRLPERIIRRVA